MVDNSSSDISDELIARINQLETKIETQELQHQSKMDEMRLAHDSEMDKLRPDYERSIEKLRKDVTDVAVRLAELESRLGEQDGTTGNTGQTKCGCCGGSDDTASFVDKRNTFAAGSEKSANAIHCYAQKSKVAFYAVLSETTEHIGANQIIAFNHVVTNLGHSYNQHNGSFIANVAGTYLFSVALMSHERSCGHYSLFLNSNKITMTYLNGHEKEYDTSAHSSILQLARGDTVTVKSTDSYAALAGGSQCSFSGFLLYEDSSYS